MRWLSLLCLALAVGCSDEASQPPTAPSTPVAPSPQSPTVMLTSVQIGTAGDASMTLSPGERRQLWAVAKYSDNTTSDVTNVALWQSSDPTIATVSSGGLLTAAAEGAIEVTATYEKARGTLRADVRRLGCEATTLSPPRLTFSAFGANSGGVLVTTPLSDCRWTARSNADWLRFSYDPQRSGTGTFSYSVPVNNYPTTRTADILVTVGGTPIIHTVSQEAPASCSYVVKPEEASFSAAGGTGAFSVSTTPGDCRWTATNNVQYYGVQLTGATSGTGAGRVTYSVAASTRGYAVSGRIEIAGLSGANPPAQHTIYIAR